MPVGGVEGNIVRLRERTIENGQATTIDISAPDLAGAEIRPLEQVVCGVQIDAGQQSAQSRENAGNIAAIDFRSNQPAFGSVSDVETLHRLTHCTGCHTAGRYQ